MLDVPHHNKLHSRASSINSIHGRRRRHSFTHPRSEIDSGDRDFNSRVTFYMLCLFQTFFFLVSIVLQLNTAFDALTFSITIARALFVVIALISAAHNSTIGLDLVRHTNKHDKNFSHHI
eukprot:c4620_g1_i1.p1 GENE.c4620_g1_i1~~c4620_g1_i1.p1  ORF type:complete len:134 (-),score=32.43 c4620_g1_i1:430-789(-)